MQHRSFRAMPFRLAPFALAALSAAATFSAGAQTRAADASVLITGNPLAREQLTQPASVLSGDRLLLRRAGTLGETLDGLPGVSQSWFGPNSNRPVIRGLDGDRVRLLDNGAAAIDASNLSFDHAVAVDPLVVERLEVLRGPAALLYGGNATGGVVNAIDNRIPRSAQAGLGGRVEVRMGGAAAERSAAAVLEGGAGPIAWHADVYGRQTDDLRVPLFTPVDGGEDLAPSRRVRNSAADSRGGAVGAAWTDADGFAGVSFDSFRNHYGVTVEPDVLIRMKRERAAFSAERRRLGGVFTQLNVQASQTRYRHEEVEGSGEVGTTFRSRGEELRLEARHAPVGPFTGIVGLQSERLNFSALGEEAFVPGTRTRSDAVLLLEELRTGAVTWTAGARVERVSVASEGDVAGAAEERFGAAATRRFTPKSASVGALWAPAPGWALSASVGRTERAPAYYELFANGLHIATAAFERGDASLQTERSTHAELGLQWKQGANSARLQVFRTSFSRYISLEASGRDIGIEPEEAGGEPELVPEYVFRSVKARLQGLEAEGRVRLADRPWTLDLLPGLDIVRGSNRDTGEALPRIAPLRLKLGLEAIQGAWRAGVQMSHAARQSRVPATDVPTAGYTLLGVWLTWAAPLAGGDALWFLRADNLGNRLATSAGTIATLRPLAPLPGRALSAGVRVRF